MTTATVWGPHLDSRPGARGLTHCCFYTIDANVNTAEKTRDISVYRENSCDFAGPLEAPQGSRTVWDRTVRTVLSGV